MARGVSPATMSLRAGSRPRNDRTAASEDAASEVVGAMLLVLIVSVAAAGFGQFILHEQEKTQEAKALQNAREREELAFLDIDVEVDDWFDDAWKDGDTTVASRFDRYKEVTFTLQGSHAEPFLVEELVLNGVHIKDFTLSRFDADAGWTEHRAVRDPIAAGHPSYDAFASVEGYPLEFQAREKFRITVNLRDDNYQAQAADPVAYDPEGRSIDFFDAVPAVLTDSFVQLEVMTGYFNKFSSTWVPPTAVMATPAALAPEADTQQLSLSATASYHPYSDEGIDVIGWHWQLLTPRRDNTTSVTPDEGRVLLPVVAGETATPSFADADSVPADFDHNCFRGRTIEVILIVTADNGMVSTAKGAYTPTGPWDSQANCPA